MTPEKAISERFERTMSLVRPPKVDRTGDLLQEIIRAYSEKHRFYHNLTHLLYGFKVLDEVMAKYPGVGSVELAFWYHDISYDTHRKDNEDISSLLAVSRITKDLGFPREYAMLVGQLILSTDHLLDPRTREAKVLLDIDLAILAGDTEEFDAYNQNIRREYAWVPEDTYRAKRKEVLDGFLTRTWIFATPELRSGPYEAKARENIARALRQLAV